MRLEEAGQERLGQVGRGWVMFDLRMEEVEFGEGWVRLCEVVKISVRLGSK